MIGNINRKELIGLSCTKGRVPFDTILLTEALYGLNENILLCRC